MSGKGFLFHAASKNKKKPEIQIIGARPLKSETQDSNYEMIDDDAIKSVTKQAAPTIIRAAGRSNGLSQKDFSKSSYDLSNISLGDSSSPKGLGNSGRYESHWDVAGFNPTFRMESDKNKSTPRPPVNRSKVPPKRPPPPRPKNRPSSRNSVTGSPWTSVDDTECGGVQLDPWTATSAFSPTLTSSSSTSEVKRQSWISNSGGSNNYAVNNEATVFNDWSIPSPTTTTTCTEPHAIALYDFSSDVAGDLQLQAGDLLLLKSHISDDWYSGINQRTQQQGMFPTNFVDIKIPLTSNDSRHVDPMPSANTMQSLSAINPMKPVIKTASSANTEVHKPLKAVGAVASWKNNLTPAVPHHATSSPPKEIFSSSGAAAATVGGGGSIADKIRMFAKPSEGAGAAISSTTTSLSKPTPPPKPKPNSAKPSFSSSSSPSSPSPGSMAIPQKVNGNANSVVKPVKTTVVENDSPSNAAVTSENRVSVKAMAAKFIDGGSPPGGASNDVSLRTSLTKGSPFNRKSVDERGSMNNNNTINVNRWSMSSRASGSGDNSNLQNRKTLTLSTGGDLLMKDKFHNMCTALYTYDTEQPGDLKFQAGDEIEITRRVNDEWWEGRLISSSSISFLHRGLNQSVGLFPSNYVAVASDAAAAPPSSSSPAAVGAIVSSSPTKFPVTESSSPPSFSTTQNNSSTSTTLNDFPAWKCALHDFPKQQDDDLDFKANDIVLALDVVNSDWLIGRAHGQQGQFPTNFVKDLDEEQQPMCKAIYDFESETKGDLELKAKDEIILLEDVNEDWFRGRIIKSKNRVGIFPKAFVMVVRPIP